MHRLEGRFENAAFKGLEKAGLVSNKGELVWTDA